MSSAEDSTRQDSPRRLGLLDAMIFVAATAAALALIRAVVLREYLADNLLKLFDVSGRSPNEVLSAVVETGLVFVPIHLSAWTLAYLIVALRKPRLPLRELARRPGFAGCFSAALTTCLGLCNVIVFILLQPIINAPINWQAYGGRLSYLIGVMYMGYGVPGFAVASTWAVFALAGYWNSEASAIDRLGRVLSLGWIGLMLAYPGALYLLWS